MAVIIEKKQLERCKHGMIKGTCALCAGHKPSATRPGLNSYRAPNHRRWLVRRYYRVFFYTQVWSKTYEKAR